MHRHWSVRNIAALTALWLLQGEASVSMAEGTFGNVTAERIEKEVHSGENWMVNGGRLTGEHYSPLMEIRTGNVDGLGLAWATDIPSPLGLVAEPLVVDGVIYLSAPFSLVYALDAATGKQLWRFDPQVRLDLSPGNSISARYNRGVAVWKGAVYVGTGDCRLIAIDAANGSKIWESRACDVHDGQGTGITAAPRVGDDKVFVGYLGSDTSARGSIGAFDARTGKELWRFWTVPGDPAKGGFETPELERASKTWPGGWAKHGGGVAWEEIRYDPVTDQVIFGTASTMPLNVKARGPGDNLYTNSVIALDADTGAYKWHYQTVPEDGWDFDATMPKIVTNLAIGGKQRRVVFEAGKSGFFYVLDAITGELLAADPIQKVTWASHVDLKTGRPVVLPEARYWEIEDPTKPAHVFPSVDGGRNWEAMAWSPNTQLVYMPVAEIGTKWCAGGHCPGTDSFGYETGEKSRPNTGRLVAWDPMKRKPLWSVTHLLPFNGGVLTTAGGLVFQGLGTGELKTFHAETGKELWSRKTGSSIQAAPVTYRIGAEQYVLVAIGTGGGMRMATRARTTTPDARGPARLLAFKLGGKREIPIEPPGQVPVPKPPARTATADQVKKGAVLWGRTGYACHTCHGDDMEAMRPTRQPGAPPDLRYMPVEMHGIWQEILLGGALASKGMFSFGQFGMTQEEAEAIHAYVIDESWKAYESQNAAGR